MKPGLYIHIPFCRRKCAYCAFYSVAAWDEPAVEAYRQALVREGAAVIAKRYAGAGLKDEGAGCITAGAAREQCADAALKDEGAGCITAGAAREQYAGAALKDGRLQPGTLYVGGGTPSLLPVSFYARLLADLSAYFDFSALTEATFEANPEHLSEEYLHELYTRTPFRRLSIGVQSFFDEDLKRLNRGHTAREALSAVASARAAGFSELSVDIIYGLHKKPADRRLHDNLQILAELDLPHFSAYALTVEPGTILQRNLALGKTEIADEAGMERDYFELAEFARARAYDAYEISNFARAGHYARHNANYWNLTPYIGLGAAAHSFHLNADTYSAGGRREWNISDWRAYTKDAEGSRAGEDLSEKDLYHEYIMTALRTQRGVGEDMLSSFSPALREEFRKRAGELIGQGRIERGGGAYRIPDRYRFLTDGIALDFF